MAEKKICFYGDKCKNGDQCPFKHIGRSDASASASPKPKIPCKNGTNCKFGVKCHYDHSSSPVTIPVPNSDKHESVNELTFSSV